MFVEITAILTALTAFTFILLTNIGAIHEGRKLREKLQNQPGRK